MTLVLEAGVFAFVWHPRLRRFWLWGIVGMHLGIALLLGLWTFAAIMIVFDVAAFGWTGSSDSNVGEETQRGDGRQSLGSRGLSVRAGKGDYQPAGLGAGEPYADML